MGLSGLSWTRTGGGGGESPAALLSSGQPPPTTLSGQVVILHRAEQTNNNQTLARGVMCYVCSYFLAGVDKEIYWKTVLKFACLDVFGDPVTLTGLFLSIL